MIPALPMLTTPTIGCAIALAATCLVGLTPPTSLPPAAATPQDPAPQAPRPGQLVLVVEGTVAQLQITFASQKVTPWAGVPKGLTSEFALLAFDAKGTELLRVPMDLSKFETDPAKIGTPVVVTGCEVRSPNIGVLVNIPLAPTAVRYAIVRGKQTIGEATAAQLAELLRRPR